MIINLEPKKSLAIPEWGLVILNECGHSVSVDLGHTELLVKTITIGDRTEVPDVYKDPTQG